ncbi:MAG TPA: cupredoxin family copper-binding protein [Longimicrobiales bacterium]|nr:cupredoxin family copper-binding protein [Longimicrobiales bacterium]
MRNRCSSRWDPDVVWPVRWRATGTRALAHRFTPLLAMAAPLAVGAVVLSACSGQSQPTRHVVEIRNFGFEPGTLHVAVGDTVVWTNRDVVPHTATARDDAWDSGALATGATWTYVADAVGEGSYICTIHPSMVGWIEVR